MTIASTRSSSSTPCCSTGTPRRHACARSRTSSTPPTRCASSVRGTDLTLSLAGRSGAVDDGHVNMPGGEVFYSPVEDSADGVVEFWEFPAVYFGQEVDGVRFVFERGRIVEASARSGEDVPDRDARHRRRRPPARRARDRLQPGHPAVHEERRASTRRSTARSISPSATRTRSRAARTSSAIHWDMVKDLRSGGRLYADGRLVQEDGGWLRSRSSGRRRPRRRARRCRRPGRGSPPACGRRSRGAGTRARTA